ncbi:PP2C family protein-serine/threonine phosphatase [Caldalkalibacillus mannanilyticus]|uniref:PP2C family protein-serine/threonine phosphatase n=1 Tax=Caldalkalibacillus mannanilyticus TaxID=1418 RepID=UPI0004682203|nr:protein phosphatase 2C domain-containing protein [Caldalkalibacillus mannanilyticus]
MSSSFFQWRYGISTHQGPKLVNEDSCFLRVGTEEGADHFALALMADGMGGLDAGNVASKLAIEQVKRWWDEHIAQLMLAEEPLRMLRKEFCTLFPLINQRIWEHGRQQGIRLGTTFSILVLYAGSYLIVHVGDSRVYHFMAEDQELIQVTEDHSWVASQVRQGRLTREEARIHPRRNLITRCLGAEPDMQVECFEGEYGAGDTFLVCTDGFYTPFRDQELLSLLLQVQTEQEELQWSSDELVRLALQAGADDNISVILLRAEEQVEGTEPLQEKRSLFSFFRDR